MTAVYGRDLGGSLGGRIGACFGLGLAVTSAALGWTSVVHAEETPATAAASASPSLAVVADVGGGASSTHSAEIRAALNTVARIHGYEPAGKLDVEGAASAEQLIVAGTVTDDPIKLEHLRFVLHVDALVRVSHVTDREGGTVRITVVTPDGFQTRLLTADTTDSVEHALDVLLPRRDGSGAAKAAAPDPEEQELWKARGGFRPTYGVMAFASVTSLRHFGFRADNASGIGTVNATATAIGVGGGLGVRLGAQYLPTLTPNPAGTFFAARLAIGIDTDFFYLRKPTGYSYAASARSTQYGGEALWVASIPIELGGAFAIGRFSEQSWHGALLGIAYAPEAQYSMVLSRSSGDFRFNPAGAELSVDVTGIDASRGDTSAAQIRIALWGVAPLNDAHPGLLSLGIGTIWY
ncbi:MAG TPA: hypothetical protein VH062_31300 [Polyangiaceae bacterium]|jgi:hypothetical protein|nr:hypothetical protein [Polyangiaceae bacterium]